MVLNFLKSSYQKVKGALSKTRSLLGNKIKLLFQGKIDADTLDSLEQLLYEADLGVETIGLLTQKVEAAYRSNPSIGSEGLLDVVRSEILNVLKQQPSQLADFPSDGNPLVILIVGVNGNGKTTSVAKLSKKFIDGGKEVLIAAADTFRAAATEQLETWAHRLNVSIVKGVPQCDPAAVVFDALSAGKSRKVDAVIIDTAGRLHTKTNLMQELDKIKRTCHKVIPYAPHETLLVIDATMGQNAVEQAKIFNKFTPLTGIILTKLDGTTKGGIVVSIQRQLGIPIKFIGVGESLEDLEPFNADAFVTALFE
jgi:fused signal recognition particle receptor